MGRGEAGTVAQGARDLRIGWHTAMARVRDVTGFVDLDRGRLLDIALGRSRSVVETWLARRDNDWLADIDVVALDPFPG
ncbi:MAG TPA: hypothetical protein VGR26_06635 [Acidimicrobiales bacterium]|nr:hypothetical protein [Acidimicrobiales bacterium]